MSPRFLSLAGACAAALALASPVAAAQGSTVTATGTGQARVLPKDRHDNTSIRIAYEAARKASITDAIDQAHEYALDYAQAAGLTLGPVTSVSDEQNGAYYGPGPGGFFGPFGPNQFCGTLRQPIVKRTKRGRRKVVGFKKVHRCFVPQYAYTTLSVTYSAT